MMLTKRRLLLLLLLPFTAQAQPIINSWNVNSNGQKATYYAQTGTAGSPVYTYTVSPDSADVLKLCYTSDSVWIRCQGLSTNMGKYLNPGYCLAQNYTFRFPRNPQAASTHTTSPMGGQIGLLLNGIPIYGLSNANSWTGSTNTPMGLGIWNMEVGKAEGFVLDTSFGAHPQQQGAYHSHTTPYRLYKNVATSTHSPIVGYAFDGYPVYGPYGYSVATNASSAVTRMKTGFAIRNITTRTTLPNGIAASQAGPAVNTTYPLGTYAEDYEWNASNGGDLDKYNGRFCVTPEYPTGTYAYFVTIDAAGKAAFPYYIGFQYYGVVDTKNITAAGQTTTVISFPTSNTTCKYPTTLPIQLKSFTGEINNTNNILSWIVLKELNVKYFIIEKSQDASNFKTLAIVNSKGNSNVEQGYTYNDETPFANNYYRLISVEYDGKETVSNIISLNRKSKGSVSIYPTFANDKIYVKATNLDIKGNLKIYNNIGRQLISSDIDLPKGNDKSINIASLYKGIYFAVIETSNGLKEVVKIFKQ